MYGFYFKYVTFRLPNVIFDSRAQATRIGAKNIAAGLQIYGMFDR